MGLFAEQGITSDTGEASGFSEGPAPQSSEMGLQSALPPYSITSWDLTLDTP